MDDEGIRLASIERVVQGGGQVSNNGAQFLLDQLRTAEAELAQRRETDVRESEAGDTPYDLNQRIEALQSALQTVHAVIYDPKYGADIEWVRGNPRAGEVMPPGS